MAKGKQGVIFCADDSLKVDKMSVKDPLFVKYLNYKVNHAMIFTIQEKCNSLVGSAIINSKFNKLNQDREDAFMMQFKNKQCKTGLRCMPGKIISLTMVIHTIKSRTRANFPNPCLKHTRK